MPDENDDGTYSLAEKIPDVIAALVVITFVSYIGAAIFSFAGASLAAVGATWYMLYSFVVLMSAVKLYGKGVFNAVKDSGSTLLKATGQNR